MVFRERFAWIWITAIVLVLGSYLLLVGLTPQTQAALPMGKRILHLAIPLGALALIALAAKVMGGMGLENSDDERDRNIARRATSVGYFVLMAGMILVGCVMPFSHGGWDLVHATLFFIALAEIAQHGLIVLGYRRGIRD